MGLKKLVVNIGFKLLGKGLVSCSKIEQVVKEELKYYDDGFVVELKVFNTDTKVAVKKMGNEFIYLGSKHNTTPDLSIIFKSYEGALLLVLGQIGVYEGYAQHRFIVKGDFIKGMPFVRILYYDVAILDARMTTTLPPKLTASTGIDALTHSIEAITGFQKNPFSTVYGLTAIELISKYLKKAVENGKDEEARLAMANASLMAGVAFSNSMVGIVHAIGHACGSVSHVAHSDAMAILLPHCMEVNLSLCEEDYSKILLAFSGPDIYSETPKKQRGKKCIDEIRNYIMELNKLSGLPIRLRDVGVKTEEFETISKTAINDGAAIVNPVEVTFERVMDILKKAY